MTKNNTSTNATGPQVDDWSLQTFLGSAKAQPPDYLIDSLIPERSLTMLCAEPGTGKTFLAMAAGIAVATGTPFLGLVTKRAPVLFVGEDAPPWDYAGVIRKLLGGSRAPKDFHVAANERLRILGWRKRVGRYIEKHGVKLVIIDTIRSMHDKNENDSAEMQTVMDELRRLSVEYGVAVVFLHHTPKPNVEGRASDYRGSSVLLGSCDLFYRMTAKETGPGKKLLTLRLVKGRGGKASGQVAARLEWDGSRATLSESATVVSLPQPSLESAVSARLEKGPAFIEDLIKVVPHNGRKPKTVREKIDEHLHTLEANGLARSTWVEGKKLWERVSEVQKEAA
jgi:hypothetical protein